MRFEHVRNPDEGWRNRLEYGSRILSSSLLFAKYELVRKMIQQSFERAEKEKHDIKLGEGSSLVEKQRDQQQTKPNKSQIA